MPSNPPTGPPDAVLRLADRLERDGKRLEAQALKAVAAQYRALSLADLVALINAVSSGETSATRVAGLDLLMSAFNSAVSELGTAPATLTTLLTTAVNTGSSAGAAMLAQAAGNPDLIEMFRVRPDREIELSRHAAKRLETYWGKEQARFAGEVQSALLEGLERGQSPAQMAARLRERVDVSRSRAMLICVNEVSTAMAAGNQAAQLDAGVTEYIWLATKDQRTRDAHRARDGKKFRWDDPPSDGHAGFPIRCRCTALAVIPEGFK